MTIDCSALVRAVTNFDIALYSNRVDSPAHDDTKELAKKQPLPVIPR